MGLFSHRHDDDKEREAAQRHRDAQQRLADARRHQQERQQSSSSQGMQSDRATQGSQGAQGQRLQPQTRTMTASSSSQQHASYPDGSWRKEFDLYVVKRGDSLFGISKQVYGDGNQWHRIQQANPIVLKNPDLIHPGLVLRIPKGQAKPLA